MHTFTGIEYVRIDVANQFGLDRLRWPDRLHWVDNNRPVLLDQTDLAKHPIEFAKACRALIQAERGEPTNHIMGLDATASGIQIMSAMSGCRNSAKAVNLIDTGNRECVYDSMTGCEGLSEYQIERDVIKKPVMTFFYGSEAVPKQILGEGKALTAFFAALYQVLPGPAGLMELFQSFWNPRANKYSWAMPDGHVVHIPVTVKEDKGIEIDEADHLRFTYRAEVQSPKAKGRALAANIVHSVDAWICRQMVKKANAAGVYLSPIHDCFYAHPNYMNEVRQWYRECMAEVADMNLVESILSQLSGRRVTYRKMTTDLSKDILASDYMLS